MEQLYTSAYWVRGISFRGVAEGTVSIGDVITHTPEPANIYDPNAIKLMVGDIHIGYMPKELCKPYSESAINNRGYISQIKHENGVVTGIEVTVITSKYLPRQAKV